MNAWQPIETAPRDGSQFLAYDVRTKKFDVCEMQDHLDGQWFCWPVQFNGEYGAMSDEFGHDLGDIKWWMPLPPPPRDPLSQEERDKITAFLVGDEEGDRDVS